MAAGADRRRVTCEGSRWTNQDDNNLMEWAGVFTRVTVARKPMRSEGSVHRRAYDLGVSFRQNAGYLSALEVAKHLGCDIKCVYDSIASKVLRAHKPVGVNNRWAIDPADITEEVITALKRQRQRESFRQWTHDEIERLISLRRSGQTWMSIGRSLHRNYNTCVGRYRQATSCKPLWRAVWHTVRELGGTNISIVDVELVMESRGYRVTYSSIRSTAVAHPGKLQVGGGVISWVRWTSKRVRSTSDEFEYLGARAS